MVNHCSRLTHSKAGVPPGALQQSTFWLIAVNRQLFWIVFCRTRACAHWRITELRFGFVFCSSGFCADFSRSTAISTEFYLVTWYFGTSNVEARPTNFFWMLYEHFYCPCQQFFHKGWTTLQSLTILKSLISWLLKFKYDVREIVLNIVITRLGFWTSCSTLHTLPWDRFIVVMRGKDEFWYRFAKSRNVRKGKCIDMHESFGFDIRWMSLFPVSPAWPFLFLSSPSSVSSVRWTSGHELRRLPAVQRSQSQSSYSAKTCSADSYWISSFPDTRPIGDEGDPDRPLQCLQRVLWVPGCSQGPRVLSAPSGNPENH